MAITNFNRSWKDLINSVRALLDEDSAGFYTDDMIFRGLVDAQMRIAQKASLRYEQTGKLPKIFKDCTAVVRGTSLTYYAPALYGLNIGDGESLTGDDIFMLLSAKVKYSYDSDHPIDDLNLGERMKDMIDVPVLSPQEFMSENNYSDGVVYMPDVVYSTNEGSRRRNKIYFKGNIAGDIHADEITFIVTYVSIWTDYNLKPEFYAQEVSKEIATSGENEQAQPIESNKVMGRFDLGLLPPYCYPAMTEYAYASIMRRDRELLPIAMQMLSRAEKLMDECAI